MTVIPICVATNEGTGADIDSSNFYEQLKELLDNVRTSSSSFLACNSRLRSAIH